MIAELPEWQPYASGDVPWIPEAAERGRVVVALAPAPASREQWSTEIVFDLLEGWSRSGHRVVLADYVLEHPMLHRKAGLANEEGLSDAALFGASVSRIARPVPGRSFFFVGTGSPAGDPEAVLATQRLGRLQDGFREAGVTFVAFVRQGCVGVSDLIGAADDVLVLAPTTEDLPYGVHEAVEKVRAVLGPSETEVAGDEPTLDEAALPEVAEPAQGLDLVDASHAEDTVPATDDGGSSTGDADAFEWAESWQEDTAEIRDSANGEREAQAHEAEMDFSAPDSDDQPVHGAQSDDAGIHAPESEPVAVPAAAISSRRPQRGADPDARRKLIWVLLAVLILVVLVVLGALG